MSAIALEELKKLPHLEVSALDGKTVNLMPLWMERTGPDSWVAPATVACLSGFWIVLT